MSKRIVLAIFVRPEIRTRKCDFAIFKNKKSAKFLLTVLGEADII